VIIPTLNEEKNIAEVIRELRRTGFSDILVIDGNSNDRTVPIAKKFGVNVIRQNGKGKGDALRQAFSHDGLSGGVVVMMDADGSMNPKEIFSFIEALENGVDLAKGSRFMPGGHSEDMTFIRRVGNSLFVLLTNFLCSTNYTDLCYGFAAFRRDAIERLYPHLQSRNFEIETEIFIKAKKLELKVMEVPSIELRRKHGKSNLSAYKDGFRILKTIVHEVFHRVD
jgi:glycosyltransferase involved in cell wall biosynthesis